MLKLYELIKHLTETGEILSTCTYNGKELHIVRHFINEEGTNLWYEAEQGGCLHILIPHELDSKLIEVRRLQEEISTKIKITWEE